MKLVFKKRAYSCRSLFFATKESFRKYVTWAIEMRRSMKEQQKCIGVMELWDTNFAYIDKENQE